MSIEYPEEVNSFTDFKMREPGSLKDAPSASSDITKKVIEEVADCVQEAIEHAANSEDANAKAYNETTQSLIDRYFMQLERSDLSDEKKASIQNEIRALHNGQSAKDTEIRTENTKRFKLFLDSMTKIAFLTGGIYALTITLAFLKDVISSYRKA